MNILVLTHSYPDQKYKWRGIFVKEQVEALGLKHDIIVVYFKVDYSHFAPFSHYSYQKNRKGRVTEYEVTINRSFPVITKIKFLSDTYRFIILTEHSRIKSYFRSWFHKQCVNYTLKKTACIISVSNALKEEIVSLCQRPVIVIHNIVDVNKFHLSDSGQVKIFNIGFLGGLNNNNKGLDLLLKSVSQLERRNFVLHIGGNGILLDNFKKMARELGIEQNCKFYGEISRNEIADFYSKLDIFVLPSRYETFGIVLIEAMACGIPVIATKCGGPQEIVTPTTGILIQKENTEELKSAIINMSENLKSYSKEAIRNYANTNFGKEVFIEQLSDLYKEILTKNQMSKKETFSKDVKHLYTESYFLENATGHDEFKIFDGKYEQLIDKFQMIINRLDLHQSDNLLDIGCGRGELVIYHSLNGGAATGVDFSDEAIKLARAKAAELNAGCTFQISSFEKIGEENKYDRIVSIDFIEHIAVEEGKIFFKKCYDLLKPGGRLLVYTYPNTIRRRFGYKLIRTLSIIKRKPLPKKEPDTISDHYKQYHLNEQNYFNLKKSALNAGFGNIRVQYIDLSIKNSFLKSVLIYTPFRHLFLKGLTMIADK